MQRASLSKSLAIAWLVSAWAFAPAAHSQATAPVVSRTVGSLTVFAGPSPGLTEAGAFAAQVRDSRPPWLIAQFRGTCEPTVLVTIVSAGDAQPRLFEAYLASRSGRDLPMAELLTAMREVLVERCERLQVIRLTFEASRLEPKDRYVGTLLRSEGWALRDGAVPTEFDRLARVAVAANDFFHRVRLRHDGRCEDDPILLAEAVHPRSMDRGPPLMPNYKDLAQAVAERYAQQCVAVQRIRFALAPMPSDHQCAVKGDCFVEARKVDGRWLVQTDQFAFRAPYQGPIATVDDMAEVLAAGRFDVLAGYDLVFSFFVATFFQAYSEQCGAHIKEPQSRRLRFVNVKRDERTGHVLSEEVTETTPFMVERADVWAYDLHHRGPGLLLLRLTMLDMARVQGQGLHAVATGGLPVHLLHAEQQRMNALLARQCVSERTDAIRRNMLARVANGGPAVSGKFSTSKHPAAPPDENAPSAPTWIESHRLGLTRQASPPAHGPAPVSEPATPPEQAGKAAPPEAAGSPQGPSVAELQQQHQRDLAQLEQAYEAQMKTANPLMRLKLEGELRFKRLQLEREHRERLKKAVR